MLSLKDCNWYRADYSGMMQVWLQLPGWRGVVSLDILTIVRWQWQQGQRSNNLLWTDFEKAAILFLLFNILEVQRSFGKRSWHSICCCLSSNVDYCIEGFLIICNCFS